MSDRFSRFLSNAQKSLASTKGTFEINEERPDGARAAAVYGFGSIRTTIVVTQ
jgi:hypothetical protein